MPLHQAQPQIKAQILLLRKLQEILQILLLVILVEHKLLYITSRGPARYFFMIVLLFEIFLNVLVLKLHYICINNIL